MAHPSTNCLNFIVTESMLSEDLTTLNEFTVLKRRRDGVEGGLGSKGQRRGRFVPRCSAHLEAEYKEPWEFDLDMSTAAFLGVEKTKEASTLENVRFMSMIGRGRTLPNEDIEATETDDAPRDMAIDVEVGMRTEVDDPSGEIGTDEVGVWRDGRDGMVGRELTEKADWEADRAAAVWKWSCSRSCWIVFTAAASASFVFSSLA